MAHVKERYSRSKAENRFAHVYEPVDGDRCIYCGMPNDGKFDHQPPVYVLHRFADGGLVTRGAIRQAFGACKLVPCCTICNMGLGAYSGSDDNDRRAEIVNWFLLDKRFPDDEFVLTMGEKLIESRLNRECDEEIYAFPGVGRVIYINALMGFIEGNFKSPNGFPDWLKMAQAELSEWLRKAPRRKSKYFLDMANLASYELLPNARDNPRGQFNG
ncbi:MAG: hypothetical protein QM744_14095 [Mesorhizobium sp.]